MLGSLKSVTFSVRYLSVFLGSSVMTSARLNAGWAGGQEDTRPVGKVIGMVAFAFAIAIVY